MSLGNPTGEQPRVGADVIRAHLFFHLQSTLTLIQAHDSPLAALTFNASGSKLASASEKVRTRFPSPF